MRKWSKEIIIEKIIEKYNSGTSLSSSDVKKDDRPLIAAAENHFGSWRKAVDSAGFDYDSFCKLQPYWSLELAIKKLQERIKSGLPLNSSRVQRDDLPLFHACIKYFGSYKNAIEYMGLTYDDIIEDINLLSYYGNRFEDLLRIILEDIFNKKITKGFTREIQPDFVFNEKEWADAKLSEWTVYGDSTVEDYEPHCEVFTIIYLRGNKEKCEYITGKTRIISVYKLLENIQLDKKVEYINKLDEIWLKSDEQEGKPSFQIEGDPKNPKGYRGVSWVKSMKKWRCYYTKDKKTFVIGYDLSELEAAKKYDSYIIDNKIPRLLNFGENPYITESNAFRFVTINGEVKTLAQWSRESGLSACLISDRIKLGWDERDLLKPTKDRAKKQSGVKGVSWNSYHNKWNVYTRKDNKQKQIGIFVELNEAIKAKEEYDQSLIV